MKGYKTTNLLCFGLQQISAGISGVLQAEHDVIC